MNYKEMIELAQSRGRGTEQVMHRNIEGGGVLMTLPFFYSQFLKNTRNSREKPTFYVL